MPVNSEFAQGVDLSMWNVTTLDNNNNRIVHPIILKKPLDFVFLRSSIGYGQDIAFTSLLKDTAHVPIRGAYHYNYVALDWKRQADNFLDTVEGTGMNMLALDYESIGNVLDLSSDIDAFKTIEYLGEQSGLPVFLYTGLASAAAMYSRGSRWVLDVPLWVARWFWKTWYDVPTTNSPYSSFRPSWATQAFWGEAKWDMWQWGGDRSPVPIYGQGQGAEYGVLSHSIDLDAYNGTPEQMRNDLGIGDDPPPPPEPITLEERVELLERKVYVLESHHNGSTPPITSPINDPEPELLKVKFDITGNHSGPIDAYDRPNGNVRGWYGKDREVRDTGERFMGTDWMRVEGTINTGEGGKFWISKEQATLVPVE